MASVHPIVNQPKSPKELGALTAETLINEMRFLRPPRNLETDNELIDTPERGSLDFQTILGEAAAKSEAAGFLGANLAGLRYCIADGTIERKVLFDIDHTDPFARIRSKQKALLVYLNDTNNQQFKEGFLSSTAIKQYFGEETEAQTGIKTIKGTRRFYKLCYNDIDNLLLLCHACNLYKNSKESLEWFGQQEPFLGQAFVKSVTDAGGLYEGVIVRKILNKAPNTPSIQIGDTECVLHQGAAQGLGQFINEWFDEEHPQYRNKMIDSYQDIWLEYKQIAERLLLAESKSPEARQAERVSDKIGLTLKACIRTIDTRYITHSSATSTTPGSSVPNSPSGSDEEADKEKRLGEIDRSIKQVFTKMHEMKKIAKEVSSHSRIKKDTVYYYLENEGTLLDNLNDIQKIAVLKEIQTNLLDWWNKQRPSLGVDPKLPDTTIDAALKEIIAQTKRKHDPEEKILRLEAQLEAERQKREAEHREKLELQAQLEAERQKNLQNTAPMNKGATVLGSGFTSISGNILGVAAPQPSSGSIATDNADMVIIDPLRIENARQAGRLAVQQAEAKRKQPSSPSAPSDSTGQKVDVVHPSANPSNAAEEETIPKHDGKRSKH